MDTPDKTKEEYKQDMLEVSEAALGLELVNHIQSCPACTKILTDANAQVMKHMSETDKLR